MDNLLLESLRDGLCVADQRCKVRNAESGCDCAKIADYIERLQNALKPFAAVVFNDNGDVTYDYSRVKRGDYWRAYHALRTHQ